jgi:hypothetical protein
VKETVLALLTRFLERSVPSLIRLACIMALAGLLALVLTVVWPKPLMVVVVMGVGHVFGAAAFLCYLAAVVVDNRRLHKEAVARASLAPSSAKATKAS